MIWLSIILTSICLTVLWVKGAGLIPWVGGSQMLLWVLPKRSIPKPNQHRKRVVSC